MDVPPAVPTDGLSLAALRTFTAEHSRAPHSVRAHVAADAAEALLCLPFAELRTWQVVEGIIKPATQDGGPGGVECTYADLLRVRTHVRCVDAYGALADATRRRRVTTQGGRT